MKDESYFPERLTGTHFSARCERAFVKQWKIEQARNDGILIALLRRPNGKMLVGEAGVSALTGGGFDWIDGPPTDRDARIVATIVQWLGSNVGRSFLEESLREIGARIVWKEEER